MVQPAKNADNTTTVAECLKDSSGVVNTSAGGVSLEDVLNVSLLNFLTSFTFEQKPDRCKSIRIYVITALNNIFH